MAIVNFLRLRNLRYLICESIVPSLRVPLQINRKKNKGQFLEVKGLVLHYFKFTTNFSFHVEHGSMERLRTRDAVYLDSESNVYRATATILTAIENHYLIRH